MAADYIIFDNVSISYNSESPPVIKHLSFSIKEEDRAVLRGESGVGKTTIFRLLLGFEIPDAGDIIYKGDYLNDETIQIIK